MLGQDGQLSQNQRQFAVFVVLEGELHLQRVFGNGLVDIAVIALVQRRAVFHQCVEGKHHVFGADRVAIVELGFGAQVKPYPAVIWRLFHLLRD